MKTITLTLGSSRVTTHLGIVAKGLNRKRVWLLIYSPLGLSSSGWFESKYSLLVRLLSHLLTPWLPQLGSALTMASLDPTKWPNQPLPSPIWKPLGSFCIFWMDRISISSYFKDNGMGMATPDGSLLLLQHLSCVNHKGAAHHDLHIITWGLRLSAEAAPLSLFYRRPWNSSRELQWEASCQAVSQWESWGRNYGSFFFF